MTSHKQKHITYYIVQQKLDQLAETEKQRPVMVEWHKTTFISQIIVMYLYSALCHFS